jgi:nucleolar pre-ribosomal-associated protein 2
MGGRMHLLIPLLQNLLGALFVPHVRSISILPYWLYENSGALKAENATAFSRILTTLSSPTVSSTQTRKHTSTSTSAPHLVDATKQARLYAGQYIPYILMHYCSLQLTGTLEGAMKEEVKRGVWSCMDVVDLEGMRALSEGIGRDERVMWASLFREWERVGKGARSGRKA